MSTLTQKHHGVPARGIQGLDGQQGRKGQSVYIGFVNDFFDYTEYDIDPAVRYTKRKVENLANTVSWRNYRDMYNTVNVDTMYYTGEFIPVDSGVLSNDSSVFRDMDVVTYNEKRPGQALVNPDSGQEPIESYEFKFIRDISYNNASGQNLSYVDVYDFVDPDDLIDNVLLNEYDPIPEYTVHIDVNHITYDYSDLKRIALMKFKALGNEKAPYDMWDIFTTHDEFGNQIEEKQTPETYKAWLDDPDMFPLFVREKLAGKFSEYVTGVTNYYGVEYTAYDSLNQPYTGYKAWPYESPDGRHYLTMPDNDEPAIEDLTYALTYFKQPVKTYPQYTFQSKDEMSEIMLDYEGYMYIGISDDTMYKVSDDGKIQLQKINDILTNIRKTDGDTPLIDQTNFTLSDQTPFINTLRDYTVTLSNKSSKELLPTNDLVVWHSGTGKLKLPTTLSSSINVGDILYFYTNIGQYSQEGNSNTLRHIEYMAVVTEDMIGCSLLYLINNALVVKPFDYSVFNNVYEQDRAEINRSTIITAINRAIPDDYDLLGFEHFNIKSMEEVLTKNEHCALRLIAANTFDNYCSASLLSCIARDYNSFENIDYKDNTLNLESTRINNLVINHITTNDKKLAINNLMVNMNKQNLNFELTKCIYDNNIIFDNDGYFIFDKMDAGNIGYELKLDMSTGTDLTHNYYYTIKKSDLLNNSSTTALSEYAIGYIIINKLGDIYAESETFGDEIKWHICISEEWIRSVNAMHISSTNTTDTLFAINPDSTAENSEVYTDFRIITTIRHRSGFRYYSNTTKLSVFANQVAFNHNNYDISRHEVYVEYPEDTIDVIESEENNIQFDIDTITCEEHIGDNAVNFKITPLNGVSVKDVYINTRLLDEASISNSWITFLDLGNNEYKLDIKDNIPDIIYNDDVYSTTNIDEYMLLLSNPEGDLQPAPLFEYLRKNKRMPSTVNRSVTVRVVYQKDNKEYSESYVITQPGFSDPRCLPELDMKLINDYKSLSEINTVENGVLCNQFRTYVDIKAGNINNSTWLMYNNDVTIDFTIELDNRDPELTASQTNLDKRYPTLKTLNFESSMDYNNFYTFRCTLENVTEDVDYTMNDRITVIQDNTPDEPKLDNFVYSFPDSDRKYYIINNKHPFLKTSGIDAMDTYAQRGLYHTMSTTFKNIPVKYLENSIRVVIDFEWANPVISSLYLKFKISDFTIHYNTENVSHKFVIPQKDDYFKDLTTDSLCINISPIQLTVCPNNTSTGINTLLHTDTVKVWANDTTVLSYKACFYNGEKPLRIHTNLYYKGDLQIRDDIVWSDNIQSNKQLTTGNHLYDKISNAIYQNPGLKSYANRPYKWMFNDNVQYIDIIKEKPSEVLTYIDTPDYYKEIIDFDIFDAPHLYKNFNDSISLSVFYDVDFFHPRYRNDKETFYFMNTLYDAERYRQVHRTDDNSFIFTPLILQDNASMQIRTNEEMDAIDTWNFEYQVACKDNLEQNYVQGEKSTYGQGYYYLYKTKLYKNPTNNPYESEKILHLTELFEKHENINLRTSGFHAYNNFSHSMTTPGAYPLNNQLFKVLTRYMRWEYLYAKGEDKVGHATMITPFESLLLSSVNKWSNMPLQYMHLGANLSLTSDKFIPYNLCYNLSQRFGRHPEHHNVFLYMMLRMPTIERDNTDITTTGSQILNANYLNITPTDGKDINAIFKQDYSSQNYK